MSSFVLCESIATPTTDFIIRPFYQLLDSTADLYGKPIATVYGRYVPAIAERFQCGFDQPMRGDIYPYDDRYVEVDSVDWLFIP